MKINKGIELATKVVTAYIPGGGVLNELFFDHRSRIKQNRINDFVKCFQTFLDENGLDDIPKEILSSEDFGDLFESVIKRIIQIKSGEKTKRLQEVIFNYVTDPVPNEYNTTYLDLIERLNETQIRILVAHSQLGNNYAAIVEKRESLKKDIKKVDERRHQLSKQGKSDSRMMNNLSKKVQDLESKLNALGNQDNLNAKSRRADYYHIPTGEYKYLIQDLYSKGLLMDMGVGHFDYVPFDTMGITDFGNDFLKFIKES